MCPTPHKLGTSSRWGLTSHALRFFTLRLAFAPAMLPVLVTALLAAPASAQEFRGTISGTVADATGAVIPGANVVVREVNTGTVNNTKSDSDGQYVVPFLLPGTYSITVTFPGFQQVVRAGSRLQSQEHPLINIALPIGRSDTTVTVTSEAPLINQANASIGQVISTESVADLPLNGRTPTTLTELSEGVITTAAPQIVHPFDNAAGNSWSIGGTPNQVSEVLLDGSPDLTLLGALAYAPTQDSVQEVSVRPFDTDASFGHTIGGVINQITKSGTNQFHGTAYEFYQTAGLDANSYFSKRQGLARPNAHYHQYGGTFGGPVGIPKLYEAKDKLFFFFAFEGLRDSTPNNVFLTVPTASERAGDFSQLLSGGCGGGAYTVNASSGVAYCNSAPTVPDPNQLYNPSTATLSGTSVVRSAIRNNQLTTAGSLNPVAAAYLNLIPLPNNTSGVGLDGQGNYATNAPSIDTYSNEFGRLDYNLNARDHVFYDFRHNHCTQLKNNYFENDTTGTTLLRENYGSTLDNVLTLNATTILDTRVNWTFFNEVHRTPAQQYSGASVGLGSLAAGSTEPQLPCILFGGTSINATLGTTTCSTSTTTFQPLGDNTSALDPTTSYQVFGDIVKTAGRHTLKIGFDGRQYRLSVQNFGNSDGTLDFGLSFVTSGTAATAAPTFGGDLASFYFGLPSSGALDNNVRSDYHSYYMGSFVQDDWRVTDKFTINAGLRFDIDTPFRERAGKTVNGFNPAAVNSASATAAAKYAAAPNATVNITGLNTLGGLTFPSGSNGAVYNTNSGFFSPRIGFSYSPNTKTVFRGGFGIFVQPETLGSLNSQGVNSSNAISNTEGFSATTNFTATSNAYLTPANTLSNPFPTGVSTPVGSSLGTSTFLGQSVSFLAPNEHDPYSERYNIGFQREVTSSTLFEMLYVGNHSLHLPIANQNLNVTQLPYLSSGPYRNQNLANAYSVNVANPFAGLLPNGGTANNATVGLGNLLVRYPQFGTAAINIQNQTIGQSYYNSGIAHVEQRTKHGLTLTANFGFSKLLEADTFLNDQDTTPTRRISPFDHTYHFTIG
ncbi:MAG: carboxypeptidase regulatory-like domain-containing protein, partial [Janthinobacterium lividum]